MKRLIFGLAVALASTMSAYGADLPVKAPTIVNPAAWSGIYFGINGAGARTATRFDFVTLPGSGNISPAGGMAGATLGFGGWNGGLYIGVEADADYDFTKANVACVLIENCKVKSGLAFSQRFVLGTALGSITNSVPVQARTNPSQWPIPVTVPANVGAANIMPYVTAGLAETDTKACITGMVNMGCQQRWLVGMEFGGGMRIPVSQHVSFDVTYLYDRFNKSFVPASTVTIFPTTFKQFSEQKLRAAAIYHF